MTHAAVLRLEPPSIVAEPAVLACEVDVLGHWYGDTPELLDRAYGGFAEQTVFIVVRDGEQRVVGFARLLRPGPNPLKTIVDLQDEPWSVDGPAAVAEAGIDLGCCWDIATLGVRPELGSSGTLVAAALYHGMFSTLRLNQVDWLLAIIDQRVRKLLNMTGLLLHTLPGTAPALYMGSPACAPVYGHLPSMFERLQGRDPRTYDRITRGAGLSGVSLPPQDAFRLPVRGSADPAGRR